MNLLTPHQCEDLIITTLLKGERGTISLLEEMRRIRPTLTKQGFYAALRKLKKNEVILIYKKKVSLDEIWLRKMKSLFTSQEVDPRTILPLNDKESALYSFSTVKSLDSFWGYVQSLLTKQSAGKDAVYSYDPHYWFYLARQEREDELLRDMVEQQKQFLMTVGGTTALDKAIKTHFNTDYLQYTHNKLFDSSSYYLTIVGDYVVEVIFDRAIAEKIEKIYASSHTITEEVIKQLQEILEMKSKNKLKILKNKNKANLLRKKLAKDFYILQ